MSKYFSTFRLSGTCRLLCLCTETKIDDFQLSEYELVIASNLIDPVGMTVDWSQIGGLSETINEIQQTVILPFRKSHLFRNSSLLQPPKG